MKAIDRLRDQEVLALGKFIVRYEQLRGTTRWRRPFADCAKRESFVPFSAECDQPALREFVRRVGHEFVCLLRTSEVLSDANQVAAAKGAAPLLLEGASSAHTAVASG